MLNFLFSMTTQYVHNLLPNYFIYNQQTKLNKYGKFYELRITLNVIRLLFHSNGSVYLSAGVGTVESAALVSVDNALRPDWHNEDSSTTTKKVNLNCCIKTNQYFKPRLPQMDKNMIRARHFH